MHTYRKVADYVWQVGFQLSGTGDFRDFIPIGPTWDEEFQAAAFASFMNGGRYSPGEVEPLFPREPLPEVE